MIGRQTRDKLPEHRQPRSDWRRAPIGRQRWRRAENPRLILSGRAVVIFHLRSIGLADIIHFIFFIKSRQFTGTRMSDGPSQMDSPPDESAEKPAKRPRRSFVAYGMLILPRRLGNWGVLEWSEGPVTNL